MSSSAAVDTRSASSWSGTQPAQAVPSVSEGQAQHALPPRRLPMARQAHAAGEIDEDGDLLDECEAARLIGGQLLDNLGGDDKWYAALPLSLSLSLCVCVCVCQLVCHLLQFTWQGRFEKYFLLNRLMVPAVLVTSIFSTQG